MDRRGFFAMLGIGALAALVTPKPTPPESLAIHCEPNPYTQWLRKGRSTPCHALRETGPAPGETGIEFYARMRQRDVDQMRLSEWTTNYFPSTTVTGEYSVETMFGG